jgi:hypothetical protein
VTFIVQKAFGAQIRRMRGLFLTFGAGMAVAAAGMVPDVAAARETDQSEAANCTDPKHRHTVVRPLTESVPIRKTEKVRVRRILM